jgi:hypothetical protein|tara:strand:+ start:880 stop:1620 length:741 start_codon:yes stop_codon:yes gene_type:complete
MSAFDQTTTVPETETPQEVEQQGVFNTLVGDERKFKTAEDLAKGKLEADNFIDQLKSELSGLREELDKRLTSEEVLAKIQEESRNSVQQEKENTTPSLSEDKVEELVKKTLESTRSEETKQENLKAVDNKLVGMFGDKAGNWLVNKSQELGVNPGFLEDVAKTSPSAFFNTVGLTESDIQKKSSVTTSSINTESLENVTQTQMAQVGTKKYYDAIRKENPRKYWTPEIQNQILASREELGSEKFYA